jgi:hypothetical protein
MRPPTRKLSAPDVLHTASLRTAQINSASAQSQTTQVTQVHQAPHAVDDTGPSESLQDHIARIQRELSGIPDKVDALKHKIQSFTSVVDPIRSSDEMQQVLNCFKLGELRRDTEFLFLITARAIDSAWECPKALAEQADRCIQAAIGLHDESANDKEDFWVELSEKLSVLPVMSAFSLVGVMEKYRKYIPLSERAAFDEAKAKLVARAQSVGFDQVKI